MGERLKDNRIGQTRHVDDSFPCHIFKSLPLFPPYLLFALCRRACTTVVEFQGSYESNDIVDPVSRLGKGVIFVWILIIRTKLLHYHVLYKYAQAEGEKYSTFFLFGLKIYIQIHVRNFSAIIKFTSL